jgi:GNAT superfamily N-acetyltransferase
VAASPELLDSLRTLLPQLSPSSRKLDQASLEAILGDPAVTLLVARAEGRIAGTASVVVFRTPDGVQARLEDVVVDEQARGAGLGQALVEAAVEVARERGASRISLTSASWRESANRLYVRAGFEQKETNVYRMSL